jgi:hypothetical protein
MSAKRRGRGHRRMPAGPRGAGLIAWVRLGIAARTNAVRKSCRTAAAPCQRGAGRATLQGPATGSKARIQTSDPWHACERH